MAFAIPDRAVWVLIKWEKDKVRDKKLLVVPVDQVEMVTVVMEIQMAVVPAGLIDFPKTTYAKTIKYNISFINPFF